MQDILEKYNVNDIAYTFYLRYCTNNCYGLVSIDFFKNHKDTYYKYYNQAVIHLRKQKIDKILKRHE